MLVAASSCNSSATHKKMKISHITRRLRLSGFRMSTRPTHFQPSSDWLVMMLMMIGMVMMRSGFREGREWVYNRVRKPLSNLGSHTHRRDFEISVNML